MKYNSELYGSLADWVGIFATVLTIFFTLRHYTNDNKIDFRIMIYSRYQSKEIAPGATSVSGSRNIIISGVNFGKYSEKFRLEGFMKKENLWQKAVRICKREKRSILPKSIELFPHEKIDYELVLPHDQSKEEIFSQDYLTNHLSINDFDLQEGFYVVYFHISGKMFKKLVKYID